MNNKIKHGGNLREAAKLYDISLENWIDLSTGINPNPWPAPDIPTSVWQRLPETDDNLLPSAHKYYGSKDLLAIAGSQVAIQTLPYCRQHSRIAIVSPCYAEHPYWWQQAGHEVLLIAVDEVEKYLPSIDVLLLINPNNPTAHLWPLKTLQAWHQQLSAHNGWLIVDEAFMDSTPQFSLLSQYQQLPEGLIILRSIGKFFGLAGIRLGFIVASQNILNKIDSMQGPWAVSHPARWLGSLALADTQWQNENSIQLNKQSDRLHKLLTHYFKIIHTSHYFCYLPHTQAEEIKHQLAQKGIWVRFFENPSAIRLGLPTNDEEYCRLNNAFSTIFHANN